MTKVAASIHSDKEFSPCFGKEDLAFFVFSQRAKIWDIALVKGKSKKIRNTCAGKFQCSVKFLPYENLQM